MSAAAGRRRADVALVERGLVESRARAQAVILAGLVFSGERRVDKAGALVADDQPLELRGRHQLGLRLSGDLEVEKAPTPTPTVETTKKLDDKEADKSEATQP